MPARKSRRAPARSRKARRPSRASPALPTHDAAGVDLTLIRWMLSLTPRERLEVIRRYMRALQRTCRSRAELEARSSIPITWEQLTPADRRAVKRVQEQGERKARTARGRVDIG